MYVYENTSTGQQLAYSALQPRLELLSQWRRLEEDQVAKSVLDDGLAREHQELRVAHAIHSAAVARAEESEQKAEVALRIAQNSAPPPPLPGSPPAREALPAPLHGVLSHPQSMAHMSLDQVAAQTQVDLDAIRADPHVGVMERNRKPEGPALRDVHAQTQVDLDAISANGNVGITAGGIVTPADVIASLAPLPAPAPDQEPTSDPAETDADPDQDGDILVPDAAPVGPVRPEQSAPKGDWVAYAAATLDLTEEQATALTKLELVQRVTKAESA